MIRLNAVCHAVLCLLGFAVLSLPACVILPVPPLGSQIGQEDIGKLKPGVSIREDVHDALGDPDASVTDRYELFELSKEKGYLTVITILPGIAGSMRAGGQDFRVVAEYAPEGVLRDLRWEARVEETDAVRYLSYGRELVIASTAMPEPSLAWGDPAMAYFDYRAVAASPDGRTLAITSYGTGSKPGGILLRDGQTGALLTEIVGYPARCPDPVSADVPPLTVFLSDSRHLASVAESPVVCVWLGVGLQDEEPRSFFSSSDRLIDLTSARAAPVLATVDDEGTVGIWDALTGSAIAAVSACPARLHCPSAPKVALSDDGLILATLQNGLGSFWAWRRTQRNVLKLWNARTGIEIASIDLPIVGPFVENLTWSPDRRRLALNLGNHVQVWQIGSLGLLDSPVISIEASAHGLGLEQVLPLPPTWLWRDGKTYPPAFPSIAFSADGNRLAAGHASAVVWEVGTWRQLWRATSAGPAALPETTFWSGFAFTGDGERIITTCCMWRLPETDEGSDSPAIAGEVR